VLFIGSIHDSPGDGTRRFLHDSADGSQSSSDSLSDASSTKTVNFWGLQLSLDLFRVMGGPIGTRMDANEGGGGVPSANSEEDSSSVWSLAIWFA